MSPGFIEHFSQLEDPRIERKKLHSLMDILVLAVCAVISGAEGWEAAWRRSGTRNGRLAEAVVPLKNGVPSHDCIAYTLSRVSVKGFQVCFAGWVEGVREHTRGEVVAVDGKTARGSHDRKRGKNPLHRQ